MSSARKTCSWLSVLTLIACPFFVSASEGFSDLVQLAEAGASPEELINFIQSSPYRHNLSDSERDVLSDLGYGGSVFDAASQKASHYTEPRYVSEDSVDEFVYPAAQPPADNSPIDVSYFYTSLAPYGKWVQIDNDWFWRPTVAVVQPHWRPYCDEGRWVQSEYGWTWASTYGWGWAPFHYGRWTRHPGYGWIWRPDTVWSPAWVSWRQGDEAMGWAPLPPSVGWDNNRFVYSDTRPEWGLSSSDFIFVGYKDLAEERWWEHRYKKEEKLRIYNGSRPIENHFVYEHDHIVNRSPRPELVVKFGGREIPRVTIAVSSKPVARVVGAIGTVLNLFRPTVQSRPVTITPREVVVIEEKNRQRIELDRQQRIHDRHWDNSRQSQEDRALKERLAAVEARREAQQHQATARNFHIDAESNDAERRRIEAVRKDRNENDARAKVDAAENYHLKQREDAARQERESQERAKQAEQAARDAERQRDAARKEDQRRADEQARRDRDQRDAESKRKQGELEAQRKSAADAAQRQQLAQQEAAAKQARDAQARAQQDALKAQDAERKAQDAAAKARVDAAKAAASEQAQRQNQLDNARKKVISNSVQRTQNAQKDDDDDNNDHGKGRGRGH